MKTIINQLHAVNDALINETANPFETYVSLREISDLTDEIMKGCKDAAVAWLNKNGQKYEDENLSVTVTRSAGTWNFKHIPQWVKQKEILKEMEEAYKDANKAWEKGRALKDSLGATIEPALYKEGGETLTFKSKIK